MIYREDDFPCELDIEWTHGGNLFRMTCDDFIYEDFGRIKLFVYLPLSLDGKHEPWVELQTIENYADDFWDVPMQKANEHWKWQRDEATSAAANDASGC